MYTAALIATLSLQKQCHGNGRQHSYLSSTGRRHDLADCRLSRCRQNVTLYTN